MYGLNKNEDLGLMIGATLTQICAGENEIILNFDKSVSVTILSDFAVSMRGDGAVRYEDPRRGAVSLMDLIGHELTGVRATDTGGVFLEFGSHSLELFDTSNEYESFWLQLADKQVVV